MQVVIVAAVARNGVIGNGGDLPWRLPEDLARFKRMTMGATLVMGRKTFESIGRPLPGRKTIVLTHRPDWVEEGVDVADSLERALDMARESGEDVFVAGGAEVYRAALRVADRLELTEVDAEPDGDTYFPQVDWTGWTETSREQRSGFAFVSYVRAGDDLG